MFSLQDKSLIDAYISDDDIFHSVSKCAGTTNACIEWHRHIIQWKCVPIGCRTYMHHQLQPVYLYIILPITYVQSLKGRLYIDSFSNINWFICCRHTYMGAYNHLQWYALSDIMICTRMKTIPHIVL